MSSMHQPYGSVGVTTAGPEPLPPGHELCRCGRPVKPWFRGRGVGHAIWLGGFAPLIGVALYGLIIALALSPEVSDTPIASAVIIGLLVVIWLIVLIILAAAAKHRGLCLLRRSLAWFILWPGVALTLIVSIFS